MSRRRLLVLAVVAAALVALLSRGWGDGGTGPQRALPPAGREPGEPMLGGLRVPPGAELVGRDIPLDAGRTRAYLRVTGDPAEVWQGLDAELRRTGHVVYVDPPGGSGCRPEAPARPDPAGAPAANPPDRPSRWLSCRLTARPATALADPGDLRGVSAGLEVGGDAGDEVNILTVTVSPDDRLPVGPSDPPVPVGLVVPLPPPSGPLPSPGGTWLSRPGGDEFHVVPGSHLLALIRDEPSVADWSQCSGGEFFALLAVTGDVEAVHDAYVDQLPGVRILGGSRSTKDLRRGTDDVRLTRAGNWIPLRSEGTYLVFRSVTDRHGDTYAVMEYCRE